VAPPPRAGISDYRIINKCPFDVYVTGKAATGAEVAHNCDSQIGCHMKLAAGQPLEYDSNSNTDFFPIGDSKGGGERLQFALDPDCADEAQLAWLELNQNPVRCPISGVEYKQDGKMNINDPGTHQDGSGAFTLAPCSGDSYLEFGAESTSTGTSPATPHVSFARQMGFTKLNMQVSFETADGSPYCEPGFERNASPFSRAQMQMQMEDCNDETMKSHAKSDKICKGKVDVCRPYCPEAGGQKFIRPLDTWDATWDHPGHYCDACVVKSHPVNDDGVPGGCSSRDPQGRCRDTMNKWVIDEHNWYAKYLSYNTCVQDEKVDTWWRQAYTVTTSANYWGHKSCVGPCVSDVQGAREYHTTGFEGKQLYGSGAAMFECWDKAGNGPQGIGWSDSGKCDPADFKSMHVTLCPKRQTCKAPPGTPGETPTPPSDTCHDPCTPVEAPESGTGSCSDRIGFCEKPGNNCGCAHVPCTPAEAKNTINEQCKGQCKCEMPLL